MVSGIELERRGKLRHGSLTNSSRKDVRNEWVKPPNVVVSFMTWIPWVPRYKPIYFYFERKIDSTCRLSHSSMKSLNDSSIREESYWTN